MPQHTPVNARRVNLLHGDDFHCAMLASLGFSTSLIHSRTGLSPGQIAYRLRMGAIKRNDYRNGDSQLAERILSQSHRVAVSEVRSHIKKVISSV
jgi:hypothetical protein